MGRHVTYLRLKTLQSGEDRIIEGWASTSREDRVGDVVVPAGARYELPLPLLFAHKHDEPIGSVISATVTRAGIRIRAKLTKGVSRAEEVWKLIQDGALTAVSVGFQALRSTPLENGGLRFDEWSWHELSVVSVPANPDAKIAVGKGVAYASKPKSTPVRAPAAVRRGKFPPDDGQALVAFGKGIGGVIREALQPLKARIGALEAAAENSAAMKFRGFWSGGTFARGDVVIHDAGLWIAISETATTPSRGAAGWALLATK